MKFLTYEEQGVLKTGILTMDGQNVVEIGSVPGCRPFDSMLQLIGSVTEQELALLAEAAKAAGAGSAVSLEDVRICAPIGRPLHDILCVGVNYRDHRTEAAENLDHFQEAAKPVYFSKRALRILGDGENIESRLDLDDELDYEVELAVIIGKKGTDIPEEKVENYIFGYSVFNDISSRKLQRQHGQWFRGKSLDTYTAMGPVILHKSALPFPVRAELTSRVNGELRQHSETGLFLTDIPALIAGLSQGMTLEPGDIIATGTPAGVGMGFHPPRYLKKGDTVVCEIPPIGTLRNTVS